MLAQLRQSTKAILWIVIVAFVGLIFVVWGMNLMRSGGVEAGIVGKIDGQRITVEQYRNELANQRAAYYQDKGRRSGAQAEDEINQLAWNSLVQSHLLWREVQQERLVATNDEVYLELQANPPAFIRAQPIFQTDSVFDQGKYLQALQDPQYDFRPLEEYIRATLPLQKLQDYVAASVRVTDEEAGLMLDLLDDKAAVSYVRVSAGDIKDDFPQPGESDLSAYYSSHSDEFKVVERRKFKSVRFDKKASAEDEGYSAERIQEALDLINEGEDFEEIAAEYSDDDATASHGGDVGWIKRGQAAAAIDSAVFSLAPGQVSGIVRTPTSLHVIKVEERRNTDGVEEARIRHIVARIEASPSTLDQIGIEAEGFAELAKRKGIDKAASEEGLSVSDSPTLPATQVATFFGIAQEDAGRIFKMERNQVADAVEGSQAFFVIQTVEIAAEHIPALEEIRDRVSQAYLVSLKRDRAGQIAEAIADAAAGGRTLEQAATAWNLETRKTELFARTSSVPGLGKENPVIATAFVLGVGQTSKAIPNGNDFFVIRLDDRKQPDLAALGQNMFQVKMSMLGTKQQAFLSDWYVDLMAKADIQDNRSARARGRSGSSSFLYTGY
jgi:peptidyl-prolyl cis-trans isomerase D